MLVAQMVGVLETGGTRNPAAPRVPGLDLTVPRGASAIVEMTVLRADGTPVDVSEGTITLTVKQHSDANATPTGFAKTGTVDTVQTSLVRFTFAPSDTSAMQVRRYVYDVWWTDGADARHQLVPVRALLVSAASGRPA